MSMLFYGGVGELFVNLKFHVLYLIISMVSMVSFHSTHKGRRFISSHHAEVHFAIFNLSAVYVSNVNHSKAECLQIFVTNFSKVYKT